jgi:hypothetical protein
MYTHQTHNPAAAHYAPQFSATQRFTTTETKTETRSSTVALALTQEIPGLTMQQVTANGTAGIITVKVTDLSSFWCCHF